MALTVIRRFCVAILVTAAILPLAAGTRGVRAEPIQEKGKRTLDTGKSIVVGADLSVR